jgi:hypothetical protein
LINTENFLEKNAPIFFYTGNEGAIEGFAENTVEPNFEISEMLQFFKGIHVGFGPGIWCRHSFC